MSARTKDSRAAMVETISHLQLIAAMAVTPTQKQIAEKLATRLTAVLPLVEPGFTDVPEKLRAWLSARLKYSDPLKVLYEVSVDMGVTLLVVGDPDNAAYEWVIVSNDDTTKPRPTQYSNVGYGMSCDALRDGLIAYHGLPDALLNLRTRLMSEPPAGASYERVLSHYADLVGDAIKVIDALEPQ